MQFPTNEEPAVTQADGQDESKVNSAAHLRGVLISRDHLSLLVNLQFSPFFLCVCK